MRFGAALEEAVLLNQQMRTKVHKNLNIKHMTNFHPTTTYNAIPADLRMEETRGVALRLLWLLIELSFLKSTVTALLNIAVSLAARRCCITEGNNLHQVIK